MGTSIIVSEKAKAIFQSPEVLQEFEPILRGGTNSYIQSAILVVSASADLQRCDPRSLVIAALRSATLGLSLDPAVRQAWIVPRKLKDVWTACFQPHYHGLYDLAVRTNKYRTISVQPIFQGEQILEDPRTGLHYISSENSNFIYKPHRDVQGLNNGFRDVTSGKSTQPIIGYFGYFMTIKGFEKTVWSTIQEIHNHAKTYAPGAYKSEYGAWQDPKKRPTMEMKTVFIQLSKFMDLSGEENNKLREALESTDIPEGEGPEGANVVTVEPSDVEEKPAESVASQESENDSEDRSWMELTTELPIESQTPGPMKPKPNESFTDGEWTRFGELVQKAHNANVKGIPEFKREKMTASQLNNATIWLKKKMEELKK